MMTTNEKPLLLYLQATPWRQLLAIMGAHHCSTSTRQTKNAVIHHLHEHLTTIATLTSIVAQLNAMAKDALRHLLAANGSIPVHTFEQRYGPIRPYKPWRKDEQAGAPQPWLAPISTTETIWYLGLLYRDPPKRTPGLVQHYVLPAELLPLLAGIVNSPTVLPSHRGQLSGAQG